MKRSYEFPELTVIRFSEEDIITTSGGRDENELPLAPFGKIYEDTND